MLHTHYIYLCILQCADNGCVIRVQGHRKLFMHIGGGHELSQHDFYGKTIFLRSDNPLFPMPMTCACVQGSQTVFKSCTFIPEILQNVDI